MTTTYECAVPFDACRYITIEADSPQEAADKAMDEVGSVSLCHKCSDEIGINDPMGVYVHDDSGRILDTTYEGETIVKLRAQVAALEAKLAAAERDAGRWRTVEASVEETWGNEAWMHILIRPDAKAEPHLQRFLAGKVDEFAATRAAMKGATQ